jgi:hypothetical protein
MKKEIIGVLVCILLVAGAVLPIVNIVNVGNAERRALDEIDSYSEDGYFISYCGGDGYFDDVGFFRPSNRMWYYDVDHDGIAAYTVGPWGKEGDLPIAGDFDGDGVYDDVGVFRASEHKWYYDYDHDGDTDDTSGPRWGEEGDLPFAGDFNLGGFDDVGVFRPSTSMWYYDWNHDGDTDRTSGPWGLEGDLPFTWASQTETIRMDVGVFRPSTGMWYYDYNGGGHTQETSGPWGREGDLPIAGDFDSDTILDDVGVFRPSEYKWYYDYDHDGDTDETSEYWGEEGDLPIAGDFDVLAPNKPTRPSGPTSGKIGEEHTYTSGSTHPENQQIYFLFDWGDGTYSEWLGPYDSGTECSASHTWTSQGDYNIMVMAKNIYGIMSDWSDPLPVNMPLKHQTILERIWELILEIFEITIP